MADAIYRLPTYGYQIPDPELEIPTFLIENTDAPVRHRTMKKVNTSSWRKEDWDPYECNEDERVIRLATWNPVLAVEEETEVSAVTIEELLEAQGTDPECTAIRSELATNRATPYMEDERGLIVRVAEVDGRCQIFVPRRMRQRVLYLSHHTPLAGQPRHNKTVLYNAKRMVSAFDDSRHSPSIQTLPFMRERKTQNSFPSGPIETFHAGKIAGIHRD